MSTASFRHLDAWKFARKLVRMVYSLTVAFPDSERFGLISQMKRAALSVPSNIAEGRGRLSNGEWQQFLGQSRGSLLELESDLIIAYDLKYCTPEQAKPVADQIRETAKRINGLLRSSQKGFVAKKYKPLPATR